MTARDLTPTQQFAARMARWTTSLDHTNDTLLWTLLRFEDRMQAHAQLDLRPLHAHALRMRNTVVPFITTRQVLELDAVLDDATWRHADARVREFARVYLAERHYTNRRTPIPWTWSGHAQLDPTARTLVLLDAQRHGVRVDDAA